MEVSVVLPTYNEELSIKNLILEIQSVLKGINKQFEIISVDDGSKDKTWDVLSKLSSEVPELRPIALLRNYGQTPATACGIDSAQGDVIIIMDADGQNSPQDIPLLLEKINEGYDMVAGYREKRQDPFLRVILSRCANALVRNASNVRIKDLGCSIKAYRQEFIKLVPLYGEMHRFLPIHVAWQGAKYTNIPVRHFSRKYGHSNYGFSRTFKVLADLWYIRYAKKNFTKPIYFFWKMAVIPLTFGIASFFVYAYLAIRFHHFLNAYFPAFLIFITMFFCLISIGIMMEVIMRVYFESSGKKTYQVKKHLP